MVSRHRTALAKGIRGIMLGLLVLAPPPARAASENRVPPLEGPSLRLDFSAPFIEGWLARPPAGRELTGLPFLPVPSLEEADARAWDKAAVLEPVSGEGPETEFRAFFGERGLFFLVRCRLEPADGAVERSPRGEELEIRLRVPVDRTGRYRPRDRAENPVHYFVVAAGGDARTGGDAAWERRVETGAGHWTARVLVPFAALGLGLPPTEIEVNIARRIPGRPLVTLVPGWTESVHRQLVLEGVDSLHESLASGIRTATTERSTVSSGDGIALEWVSGIARPRDRWIEGSVQLDDSVFRSGDEVEASLRAPGSAGPLEVVRLRPERLSGRLSVDLRRWGLAAGAVTVRLLRGGEVVGLSESLVEARPLPPAFEEGFRIPLVVDRVDGPAPEGPWPLNAGVPFPAGAAWKAEGWVVEDDTGRPWPTQLEATGHWSTGGSIKWLRVDTVAPPEVPLFLVRRAAGVSPEPAHPVRVEREGARLLLANGLSSYELSGEGAPLSVISAGGRTVARVSGVRGLYLVDNRGRLATAVDAGIRVEAAGPVAACVRLEGYYRTADGEPLARHITRVELFAGREFARVTHTLVLTRDTRETWFREAGWEFEVEPGGAPEAFFAVSREEPGDFRRFPAGGETRLVQESHFRFGAGEKRFGLYRDGAEVLSGEEMGDWFVLQGAGGGLVISCREAARQHPKEFSVAGSRANLLLFSPRSSEELDFRTETLIERWNLRDWFRDYQGEGRTRDEAMLESRLEAVGKIESNAAGWAKTHEILLSPSATRREGEEAAALSRHHSRPVFALADPAWTWRTRALGFLYPRDPERFPEAERLVDEALEFFAGHVARFGLHGFIDYNAGPIFNYPAGARYPMPRRWGISYTVIPDSWLVFARSGSREAFDFATGSSRAYADNFFAHADGPGRVSGLPTVRDAPDAWTGSMGLPFYWGSGTRDISYDHMTNNDQFALDYHILGWRRAADVLENHADGILRAWTPALKRASWDVLPDLRVLAQAYEFTRDPAFRELARNALDYLRDPESPVGMNKDRRAYRYTTYKTRVQFRDLLSAWEIFGDPAYHRALLQVADYLWPQQAQGWPVSYTSPTGLLGAFLYDSGRHPEVAHHLLAAVRRAATLVGEGRVVSLGAHLGTFIFEGIPAALDAIVRSGADRNPAASRAGANDFGSPVDFYFFKGDLESVHLDLQSSGDERRIDGPRLEMVTPARFGPDLMSSGRRFPGGRSTWTVPKDAPEGVFRLDPATAGTHLASAWGTRAVPPLVLHAPGYWVPAPAQNPPVRWFFRVPEGAVRPAVFFEGRARVYAPEGEPWRESGDVAEWLELPADRPGPWSFVPLDGRLVRVRNLPPFFAAESPGAWFDPGVAWEPEPDRETAVPGAGGFVEGLGGAQGLFIPGRGSFSFEGGEVLDEVAGRQFLPFIEGTVEFWFKPLEWDTFEMPRDPREQSVAVPLLRIDGAGTPWQLSYLVDYGTPHNMWTHALYIAIRSQDSGGRPAGAFRASRRFTLLERGKWTHLAFAWKDGRVSVFVDGSPGQTYRDGPARSVPADMPRSLSLPGLGGVVNHLRVSDIARYEGDFSPLPGPPRPDRHTRAYFSLDGTLEGVSGDGSTIEGVFRP